MEKRRERSKNLNFYYTKIFSSLKKGNENGMSRNFWPYIKNNGIENDSEKLSNKIRSKKERKTKKGIF